METDTKSPHVSILLAKSTRTIKYDLVSNFSTPAAVIRLDNLCNCPILG